MRASHRAPTQRPTHHQRGLFFGRQDLAAGGRFRRQGGEGIQCCCHAHDSSPPVHNVATPPPFREEIMHKIGGATAHGFNEAACSGIGCARPVPSLSERAFSGSTS